MKDRIAKRIAKANEEYKENKRTKRNKTEAAFYPSDICAALKNAGGGTNEDSNSTGGGFYDRVQERPERSETNPAPEIDIDDFITSHIEGRVAEALAAYKRFFGDCADDDYKHVFYVGDFQQIARTGCDVSSMVFNSLQTGFMIGYRAAIDDIKEQHLI